MRYARTLTALAAVALLSAALTGCSSEPKSSVQSNSPASGGTDHGLPYRTPETAQPTAASCEVGEEINSQGACAPCADYENCYSSPTDMFHFYNVVIPWIREYADATYASMSEPQWYYVASGESGRTSCNSGYDDTAYFYCPADTAVFIAEKQAWEFYTDAGDAGVAIGIAHEWGHHVQSVAELKNPGLSNQAFTIRKENQADCIAGAWFGNMIQRERVTRDDLSDADSIIALIASSEDDPNRDHGTIQERTESLLLGMRQGIRACNDYFPATPVIG